MIALLRPVIEDADGLATGRIHFDIWCVFEGGKSESQRRWLRVAGSLLQACAEGLAKLQ